jgi:hypothetical protein
MTPEEELQIRIIELRQIVTNFRVVGSGISGSFSKGYDLQQPDTIDPDNEIDNPLPGFGQDPSENVF